MNTITLSTKNDKKLIWTEGAATPLQMWKGTHLAFSAYAINIREWRDAPAEIQRKALATAKRAGRAINTSEVLVAWDGCGHTLTISTQEIANTVRKLIPAEIAAAAERAAKRAEEIEMRQKEYEAYKAKIIAECPADCEPCRAGEWFDGPMTLVAEDGTEIRQWDDIDLHGCGIAYIKREVLDKQRADKFEY